MKKNSAYTLLQISKETGIPSIEVGNGLEELLKVEKVKKGSNGDNRTLWEKQEET